MATPCAGLVAVYGYGFFFPSPLLVRLFELAVSERASERPTGTGGDEQKFEKEKHKKKKCFTSQCYPDIRQCLEQIFFFFVFFFSDRFVSRGWK